jgi:hypothetical protein
LGFIYLKFYEQFNKKNSNLDDLGSEWSLGRRNEIFLIGRNGIFK